MKNSNVWSAALAMGAMTLFAAGAEAQFANDGPLVRGPVTSVNGGTVGSANVQEFYGNGYIPNGGNFYSPYGYSPYYDVNGMGYGYNPYAVFDGNGYYPNNYYGDANYGSPYYNSNGNYQGLPNQNGAPNGAQNPAYYRPPAATAAAARILPRTTDTLEAHRVRGDKFYIGWAGDNNSVNKITFAMMDINKKPIMTRTVTQAPGEYTFPITSRMAYYQVIVEYVNGTTNTVTSPL